MNDTIFETEHWRIALMTDQGYLGRCVIILKRPCGSFSEMKDQEMIDFLGVVRKLEFAAKSAFGAIMCNWTILMNNAYQNNPPDPQVHWHFRPRYTHSVEFVGMAFVDPRFGYHYDNTQEVEVSNEVKAQILEEYKKFI